MYCKIFHINDQNISRKVISQLSHLHDGKIITDDLNIKKALSAASFDCDDLSELFPSIHPKTFQIYESAFKLIQSYKNHLSKITYRDIPIFNILEPLLRDDFVLYEKINFLLEKNENIIFLFKNQSQVLFLINKLAKKLNYEIDDDGILMIENQNIEKISSFKMIKPLKTRVFLTLKKQSKGKVLKSIYKKLDYIKNQKNLCAIFLTPSTKYVLKPIFSIIDEFKKKSSPYCLISFDHELVKELKQENLFTTDFSRDALILSSIIENSDEGKKSFNKILEISKNQNLEIIHLNRNINQKLYKLFRFLAMQEISSYIFTDFEPKSTIIAFDGNTMGNSIALAAKSQNIPSYSICSLYILPHAIMKLNFVTDFILVYGMHGRDTLIELGYPPDKIEITGNVMYDYLLDIDVKECKEKINKLFNLNPKKPLIVLGSGRWYPNDEIWIPEFIKFCNKKNFELIIKPHPIYLTTDNTFHQYFVDKIQNQCKDMNYYIDLTTKSDVLLPSADLVITDQSNLGIEAGLLGKPWITMNFQNTDHDFLFKTEKHLSESIHVTDFHDLEKNILAIFPTNERSDLINYHKKNLENKFNFAGNRKSSENIFNIIQKNS